MDPLITLATLIFGFITGYILYEYTQYRVGGVVAIPVLVIYSIDSPALLPIFIAGICFCFFTGSWIANRLLIYGRRLLYIFMIFSVFITSTMIFLAGEYYSNEIILITVGTIFPGILAFNLYREIFDKQSAIKSILIISMNWVIVFLFAVILISVIG